MYSESVNVIKRQRCNNNLFAWLIKRIAIAIKLGKMFFRLQHVGDQITVGQHGTFGNASGAAGILQNGNIIAECTHRFHKWPTGAELEGFTEANSIRQIERWHHLLDVLGDKINQSTLGCGETIRQAGYDQIFKRCIFDDTFYQMPKHIQKDQSSGTRVVELMMHLTSSVERTGVDNNQTSF